MMQENWWDADEVVDAGKKGDPQRAFELTKATVEDLDRIKPRVSPATAGFFGAMQAPDENRMMMKSGIAGTPGYDLYSDILSVQGRGMIDQLMQMKIASPNGASGLGGLNQGEGEALKSIIGNLNNRQSPEQLRKNIERARQLTTRLVPGVTQDTPIDLSGGQSRTTAPQGAYYKDPQGNIRRNDNMDKGNPIIVPAGGNVAAGVKQRTATTDLKKKYGLE